MKKELLYLLVLLIGISPLFTSCSDDDDDNGERKNEIVYPSNVTQIVGGSYIDYGIENGISKVTFFLYGTGFSYDSSINDWQGKGTMLSLEVISSSAGIVPGKYTYNREETAGTFSQLEFGTYDTTTGTYGEGRVPFGEGTFEIKKSGSNYEIIISSKSQDNKDLKVYYFGQLIEGTDE